MHAGNIATSQRLQATLKALPYRRWRSTREIGQDTGSCAVHSDICAVRANGYYIETRREGRFYYYRRNSRRYNERQATA